MEVELRETPAIRVAAIRHNGPYPEIGAAFDRLGSWMREHNVHGRVLAQFFDDPHKVPEADLRSNACVETFDQVPLGEDMFMSEIRGGTYAVATYVGHFEGLPDAWFQFFTLWIPGAGLAPVEGPCFEVYLDDPHTTEWSQMRTELWTAAERKRQQHDRYRLLTSG